MRKFALALCLLLPVVLLSSCRDLTSAAAVPLRAVDTTLLLKPSADQLAKAVPVHNIHCPTDGEKIGSMGPGVPVVYKGRAVLLCCANCPREFARDPDKYLAVALADTVPDK